MSQQNKTFGETLAENGRNVGSDVLKVAIDAATRGQRRPSRVRPSDVAPTSSRAKYTGDTAAGYADIEDTESQQAQGFAQGGKVLNNKFWRKKNG